MPSDLVGTAARAEARAPLEFGTAELAATVDGPVAAARYGDLESEYRVLGKGCGLVDRLWMEHLELIGEDRRRFLNGLVTGDTRTLEAGDGRYVFFTSVQGRILAEVRVRALASSLLLELPAGCGEPIAEHLSRYIVADRVEVVPRPELRALTLVGPAASAVAARFSAGASTAPERWSSQAVEWEGVQVVLAREERLGAPAITVQVADDAAQELASELLRRSAGATVGAVGYAAAEALRIESGLARFGPDYGAERFPQEVGETDALDFEKGCYLGQEVIARIHYRGKVNHRLCGLRLRGEELPPPGSAVDLDGDEVGRSGSTTRSPSFDEGIALAVLHRKAEPGADIGVAGIAGKVVDLPFVVD